MLQKHTLTFSLVRDAAAQQVIAELSREIWLEYYEPIIEAAQVKYMLEQFETPYAIQDEIDNGVVYFLITHNDVTVGYTAFTVQASDHEVYISKLYLRKIYRQQGLGRMTLSFIEDITRRRHCARMRLSVNKCNASSIAFYERCGFAITGECVRDIGSGFVRDDYEMEKAIADKH